jgi:hypothetical protein
MFFLKHMNSEGARVIEKTSLLPMIHRGPDKKN